MKSNTINYALFGVVLSIYILYFIILRIVLPVNYSIPTHLNHIIEYAQNTEWPEAEKSMDELMNVWDKTKYFVALNYAEEDYSLFIDNLSKMQGAIQTKDNVETVSQAVSSLKLWNHFIKVIPQP